MKRAHPDAQLLDLVSVGRVLGLSVWTVREYVSAGVLPTVTFPCPLNPKRALRRKLVDRADLDRFIAAHKSGSAL
jgi:hypothetical protein